MAKRPYIQFYIGDYIKDTRILPLNVRGAWVDLILFMWDNQHKGEISGTIEEFSRLMCCSIEEASLVIQTLKQKNIFSYEELPGGILKIVSRKQKRMDQLSQIRSESGKNGGNPALKQPKQEYLLKQKDKLNAEYEYDNENKDRIDDSKEGVGEKKEEREGWNQMPGQEAQNLELPEMKAGAVHQLLVLQGSKDATKQDVLKLWGIFKIQNLTGSKFYNTQNDVFSHFINWSKTQKINGTHQQQSGKSNPKTAGVNRLLGNLKGKLSAGGTENATS